MVNAITYICLWKINLQKKHIISIVQFSNLNLKNQIIFEQKVTTLSHWEKGGLKKLYI